MKRARFTNRRNKSVSVDIQTDIYQKIYKSIQLIYHFQYE